MGTTLYLLRQQPDRISSSLFRASDADDMEVVFLEQAASGVPASLKGVVVAAEGMAQSHSIPTMTYDDLIEKIFTSEHVIVV